jgi:hypothetical protein
MKKGDLKSLKKVLLTTLMTASPSVSGWYAQAHGNRSSHATAEIRWSVDDYIVNRETLLNPDDLNTFLLRDLDFSIQNLKRERIRLDDQRSIVLNRLRLIEEYSEKPLIGFTPQMPSVTSREIAMMELSTRKSSLKSLSTSLDSQDAFLVDSLENLSQQKLAIEKALILTPTTKQVLNRLVANDLKAANAILQGVGTPVQVIENYIWTQLDLQNLGVAEGRTTAKYLDLNMKLAEEGMKYAVDAEMKATSPEDKLSIKKARAALLNNLANFTTPDTSRPNEVTISADKLKIGRDAAMEALKIREEIGSPLEIIKAKWMVGFHHLMNQDRSEAKKIFETTIVDSEALNDENEKAWSIFLLAVTIKRDDPVQATKLAKDATFIFEKLGDNEGLAMAAREMN